jgi:hypothetical protein
MVNFIKTNWVIFLVASLTLGLAPFSPEPHLWGKIKWVMGGAKNMQGMDWFDLVLHGTPWVLLLSSATLNLVQKFKTK